MEMEIPLRLITKQENIIAQYIEELELYKEAVKKAEKSWSDIRENIYEELT